MRQNLALTAAFFLLSVMGSAQEIKKDTAQAALFTEIIKLDSTVFAAFNAREVEQFKAFFSKDLEFYHDKGGLTGFDHTIEFLQTLAKSNSDVKRVLVKETSEVYPIPGYGAMQIGSHKFCHSENDKTGCGTFRFVHIWRNVNNSWKITRVVSYDH